MFVRVGPGGNLDEGLDNSASTEDLSARTGMGADEGRNNSTACKFGFLRIASLNGSNTVFRSRKTNKKNYAIYQTHSCWETCKKGHRQTVKTQIRFHMWHLIRVYIVCQHDFHQK